MKRLPLPKNGKIRTSMALTGAALAFAAATAAATATALMAAPLPDGPGGPGGVTSPGAGAPAAPGAVSPESLMKQRPTRPDTKCRDEVRAAFDKQRGLKTFRMKTRMIDQRGPVFMTVDYELPLKMRQRVKVLTQPEAFNTILIGPRAWSRVGESEAWKPLPQEQVSELMEQLNETVIDPPQDPLYYDCMGAIDKDGRALKAYEAVQTDARGNPTDGSPVRIVHVDAETGLPVVNMLTTLDNPDNSFFKVEYFYPEDLAIEPPQTD